MTTPERKEFGKKQSTIQKLIDDVPGLKRVSALPIRDIIDIAPLPGPLKLLKKFAGGGIAKEAGVSSGPPPERGPNSEGLASLRNYATRTME